MGGKGNTINHPLLLEVSMPAPSWQDSSMGDSQGLTKLVLKQVMFTQTFAPFISKTVVEESRIAIFKPV